MLRRWQVFSFLCFLKFLFFFFFLLSCPQRSQRNKSNKNKANLRTKSLISDTKGRSSRQFFLPLLQSNTERKKYNLSVEWDIIGIGFCLS